MPSRIARSLLAPFSRSQATGFHEGSLGGDFTCQRRVNLVLDLGRVPGHDAQVLEHARRDSNAGCGERRPDERMCEGRTLGREPIGDPVPKREWCSDADDRNEQRRPPNPQEGAQVRFEADIEEQDENADLSQNQNGGFRAEKCDLTPPTTQVATGCPGRYPPAAPRERVAAPSALPDDRPLLRR